MDKTLLGRIIAREWLIFLGAIGIGLILFIVLPIVNNNLNYREYQKRLSQYQKQLSQLNKNHPEPENEYEKKFSQWIQEKPSTLDDIWGVGRGETTKRHKIQTLIDIPPDILRLLSQPVPPQRKPPESPNWLIVFFPYIIIQFIKSIIWAIKQVY